MSDRLPSDHDAVTSHRIHLDSVGRTNRLRIPLPEAIRIDADELLRLSLAGAEYHAQVGTTLAGDHCLEGAFDNDRLARTSDGENRLAAWLADIDASAGDPLLVDVVTEGFKLGVREPGKRIVYTATEPPSDSLADIARDLDE